MSAAPALIAQPGICECGCGKPTSISKKNHATRGYVRGQHLRFARGHRINTRRPLLERFVEKYEVNPETGCWEWTGSLFTATGYGNLPIDSVPRGAHRVAYELFNGPIPDGFVVDHLCGVRHCVNPAHLAAVSHQDHMKSHAERRTHCRNNHELTAENVAFIRVCVTCRDEGNRRRKGAA